MISKETLFAEEGGAEEVHQRFLKPQWKEAVRIPREPIHAPIYAVGLPVLCKSDSRIVCYSDLHHIAIDVLTNKQIEVCRQVRIEAVTCTLGAPLSAQMVARRCPIWSVLWTNNCDAPIHAPIIPEVVGISITVNCPHFVEQLDR